ncbi:fumarylacetoacetase [bacterium]|nr:fumarylacetoacetase [bacterium]
MSSRSFLLVPAGSHFPLENIPFGVFSVQGESSPPRGATRIGDTVIDLAALEQEGLLPGDSFRNATTLNRFIERGRAHWREIRKTLQQLFSAENERIRDNTELCARVCHDLSQVELHLPVTIGDYTDFYSSREHATNVGTMFRDPENALLPNWLHLPVGYNGRASSVVVSGTDVRRPSGQLKGDRESAPHFAPSRLFDFEIEMGCIIGKENPLGESLSVDEAVDAIFGMVLVNDWSARDIQKWEYVPLGPFLGKSMATSISPWIVTLDALEPFRTECPKQDPTPLPYLQPREHWTYDIELEAHLLPEGETQQTVIAKTNFRYLYWSIMQQVAHHTSNGCNLRVGDLLASGTISGPEPGSYGSLLELSWKGTKPLTLHSGETRTFLQDYDRLTITGFCSGEGTRIGFGEVSGRVLPAHP